MVICTPYAVCYNTHFFPYTYCTLTIVSAMHGNSTACQHIKYSIACLFVHLRQSNIWQYAVLYQALLLLCCTYSLLLLLSEMYTTLYVVFTWTLNLHETMWPYSFEYRKSVTQQERASQGLHQNEAASFVQEKLVLVQFFSVNIVTLANGG